MRVREMTGDDLDAVTALCAQLGYPSTREQVARRFALIADDQEAALFVAEAPDGSVTGWIYVRGVRLMEMDPSAEIWGLVVDEARRGRGVGRALMRRAEEWALGMGYTEMRLRSNVIRAQAHRFYQSLGYEIAKTSYVLRKSLEV